MPLPTLLRAPACVCPACSVATVFARGTIQTANVTASGTSNVVLSGVTKAVGAQLEGISKLFVDAASGMEFYGHWLIYPASHTVNFVHTAAIPL